MGLFLHLGPSGAGKSYGLFKRVFTEAAAEPSRNFLMIVPEQFTLQTQRDIIAMHDKHGIMNIDVLSFPRMAHRVFGELGIKDPVILEDTGKSMIVKKVALDRRDRLGIYAGKVTRQGFIDEMKSVIAEFYQYGIDSARFERMCELAQGRPQLARKLQDIGVIYEGFREFIEGRFLMNEEVLDAFCDAVPRSESLKDACVCFDGFTGFTTSQFRVIDALMDRVRDIHVTLTIDPRDAGRMLSEEDLFYLSFKTAMQLERLAAAHGMDTERIVQDGTPHRFTGRPALAALEHNIFRYPLKASPDSDGIAVCSLESPNAEIGFVIAEIERLVNEEGMRYRDIAVVSGDMSVFSRSADREFTRAGIPFFLDEKRNIVGTAPVELLRAAIEIAESDFSYESVFRFIKTGLTPVNDEQCSILENFCLARNIRGMKRWGTEWDGEYSTRYKPDREELNRLRAQIFDILSGPVARLRKSSGTVNERIGALTDILASCEVEHRLEMSSELLSVSSVEADRLRAREEGQLYPTILKVFERIGLLLGDDVISLREFREILETGFKEARLALTPPGMDSVLIGDIERSRLDAVRVLFFIGVNDGTIPKTGSDAGLLSDADRTVFEENDIELAPTRRRSTYLGEFYLYLNLTKPSDRLYVTFHRMTADRRESRPSYLIATLTKLFTGLKVREVHPGESELLKGTDRGISAAAGIVRDKSCGELNEAERTVIALIAGEHPEEYARIMKAAFFTPCRERLTPDNARRLYNNVLKGSVTLMEKYASCAFAHFLNYGLRLEERRKYEIGGIELGNIYHKALENYCVELKEHGILWHQTDEAVRTETASRALDEALMQYTELLGSSERMNYARTRIERVLSRTVEELDRQVKAGDFEPGYFEETFSCATSYMELTGKIDRMDVCEHDGRKYLRVIDYKSGTKDFDLGRLYHGLQIQLGVYLREGLRKLTEDGADASPAGIFYYNIDDPILDVDVSSEEEAVRKHNEALRLKGPSNALNDVLVMHDNAFAPGESDKPLKPGTQSSVIRVKTTKDGIPDSRSKLMTEERFDELGRYLELSMNRMGCEIMDGAADIAPSHYDNEKACTYCRYGNVCGFDTRLGYRYRELRKYKSEDELWEKINGVLNRSGS